MSDKFITAIGAIVLATGIIVTVGLLVSLPVMWLWNYCLVDAVTILKPISWLQAWGIVALCGMLFKTSVTQKAN